MRRPVPQFQQPYLWAKARKKRKNMITAPVCQAEPGASVLPFLFFYFYFYYTLAEL
jgi:hypothetical protein